MVKPLCIVRGSINIDEYFHVDHISRPGETISSSGHSKKIGGKGANQAVAIARAGGRVDFYGAIGEDGLWLKKELGSYGVGVDSLIQSRESTGRAIIQVDANGENSIILFPGANHAQDLEERFAKSDFPESSHILLQNEIHPASLLFAIENAPKDAVIIFNPSPIPSKDQIKQIPWHRINWLIVNETESRELLDELLSNKGSPSGIEELVRELSDKTGSNVVCTLGGKGVTGYHRSGWLISVAAIKLGPGGVVDSTGAGDCFAGYFVAGLMEPGEEDIKRILESATKAAGLSVQVPGTISSIPSADQVVGC